MRHIIPVPAYALVQVWPFIKDMVQKGCEKSYGEFTPEGLYKSCQDENIRLYTLLEDTTCTGVWFISIVEGKVGKIAWGLLCSTKKGGYLDSIEQWVTLLRELLQREGVTRFRFAGRIGWEKVLEEYSPVVVYKVYEIEV